MVNKSVRVNCTVHFESNKPSLAATRGPGVRVTAIVRGVELSKAAAVKDT